MIIIARRPGQLGNQLFVFAHFIAWAIDHKVTISNLAFFEVAHLFEGTNADVLSRYPPRRSLVPPLKMLRLSLYWIANRVAAVFARTWLFKRLIEVLRIEWHEIYSLRSADFERIASKPLVFAQGWLFEDETGFSAHSEDIRQFFSPRRVHRDNVERVLSDARADSDVLVGIHIRRGDYGDFLGGKYLFTPAQYQDVMRKTKELFSGRRVTFLICSDEQLDHSSWTSKFRCHFGTGVPVEDMYAFGGCDYIVGPPSTFTSWASYYGRVPLFMIEDGAAPTSLGDFSVRTSQMTFPEIVTLREKHRRGEVEARSPWLGDRG